MEKHEDGLLRRTGHDGGSGQGRREVFASWQTPSGSAVALVAMAGKAERPVADLAEA